MRIGIPKELKASESRVAMTPAGVKTLTQSGHEVRVQRSAGEAAGFLDSEYKKSGARIVQAASDVWAADLVIKVKEPLPKEFRYFRPGQTLFAFLHLAPNKPLTRALLKNNVIAIGYETVEGEGHHLPILRAMSEIAGRVAVLVGNYFQGNPQGGRGMLYGGVTGVAPANVVILGGGTVGENAARVASQMGSQVTILERFPERREYLQKALEGVSIIEATTATVQRAVIAADILIGALHIPGATTPRLVTRRMVRAMKPRSVIVDVAIDQGGSCETSRPTSHLKPVYVAEGVLHYCVPNMPGAYARTSTLSLAHTTLPFIQALANLGFPDCVFQQPGMAKGVQCYKGHLTSEPIARAHGLHFTPLASVVTQA